MLGLRKKEEKEYRIMCIEYLFCSNFRWIYWIVIDTLVRFDNTNQPNNFKILSNSKRRQTVEDP